MLTTAAFGEFTDAPNLVDRVCAGCNTRRLSCLDQQVARSGPEGLLRKFYAVQGRPDNAKVNPFGRGSAGARRVELSAFDREVGVEVNLEIQDGVVTQLCELIFLEIASGKTHHFPLNESMTPAQVRAGMDRLAIVEPFDTRVSCYPHEQDWVQRLMKESIPGVQFSEGKTMSRVLEKPTAKFVLNERYFRGFAKIAFHYFLTQFPMYTGHEEIFSRIREFICVDAREPIRRVNEFISERQLPLLQEMLDPRVRPDGWRAHLLSAEAQPGICVAYVQMFLTKEYVPPIYKIILARDIAVTQRGAFAHAYRYFPNGKRDRFSGEAKSLPAIRMDMAFSPDKPVIGFD